MTTVGQMKRSLLRCLGVHGLVASGHGVKVQSDEVLWIIEPDELPKRNRLGVDVGCSLKAVSYGSAARGANECQIYVGLENLPLHINPTPSLQRMDDYRSFTSAVLDVTADLDDDERALALDRIVEPLVELVTTTRTEDELRSRFAVGVFDSAFVHRDTRARLERS